MVTVSKFYVTYYGDESVGMFGHEWVIEGPFSFNNREEEKEFTDSLADAFELVCPDRPDVESQEARDERWNEAEKWRYDCGAEHPMPGLDSEPDGGDF